MYAVLRGEKVPDKNIDIDEVIDRILLPANEIGMDFTRSFLGLLLRGKG